jgi:hypothetical protein
MTALAWSLLHRADSGPGLRARRRRRHGLRRAGIDTDEDELIAFQIHGVSPQFVEQLEDLGYSDLESDQLVAMRIHGVTPEFISDMKLRGSEDLSVDKLLALRIHGID